MSRRASRSRRYRRSHREYPDTGIDIRVGSRRDKDERSYLYLKLNGPQDGPRFEGLLDHVVRSNPGEPILLVCNGYQDWLEDVFQSCLMTLYSDRQELNWATQYTDTLRFPESTYRRLRKNLYLPWTFIVDQINVPHVYYWSFGERPFNLDADNLPVDKYRFRVGVWNCAQGAYVHDDKIAVTMVFLRKTEITENFAKFAFFRNMFDDEEDHLIERTDESYLAYVFLKIFTLITDWTNVLLEFEGRLDAAEENSKHRKLPVVLRTMTLHHQIDRLYDLLIYVRFHSACFKKLSKLKTSKDGKGSQISRPGADTEDDVTWEQVDDELENLDQTNYELSALKERFDNLATLEFNIENANQSGDSRFLTIVATLFLPLSFLASIWGMTTFTGTPIEYLWAAIPVFVVSAIFVSVFRSAMKLAQKVFYPEEKRRLEMKRSNYSLLGEDLPDAFDAAGEPGKPQIRRGRSKNEGRRRRSRSVNSEKDANGYRRTADSGY